MARRILDVGNCDLDHGQLRGLIESVCDATVVRCHTSEDALSALRQGPVDLVLVNRIFDRDQSQGIDLIRRVKADRLTCGTPCLLITNFPEHQTQAIAAGAEPGFGKRDLDRASTRQLLARYLSVEMPSGS